MLTNNLYIMILFIAGGGRQKFALPVGGYAKNN